MLKDILEKRERALKGELSFMPFGLKTFGRIIPGQIPELPTICTGSTSSGKSTLCRYLYCIDAVTFAIKNNADYKLILFNLEDSNSQVEDVIRSHIYYKTYGDFIDIIYLNSMKRDSNNKELILTDKEVERLHEIEPKVQQYLSYIIMFDNLYTPKEIYNEVFKVAQCCGTFYNKGKELTKSEVITNKPWDRYNKNTKTLYSVLVDNANKLHPGEEEKNLYEAIIKLNIYACTYIIKGFGFHYCGLHQQTADSTSLDAIKSDYFYPKETTLGDATFPSRDARQMFGICSPLKYKQNKLGKYDLTKFKGLFRVINVIKNTYGATGTLIPVLMLPTVCEFIPLPLEPTEDEMKEIDAILEKVKEYENI